MLKTTTEVQAKKRITVIGGVVNLVLSFLKIGFGWVGQSHALIADGFHSLSDLLTDGLVYYASHHGSQDADDEHPYGHARFETLATVILGALLIAVAGVIVWDAVSMFHQTMKVAKETKSALLKANAWHHRSDAISSFIVLIGVGLEMAGFRYFDSIAALIVGFMVVKIGFDLVLDASKELVDTALDAATVEQIRQVILGVRGVTALHFLRTRKMGEKAWVDVHILVNPLISVSEGHLISETVRISLTDGMENIGEVMVHIDPEDDEVFAPSTALPARWELMKKFELAWEGLAEKGEVTNINLHYLDGSVHVEIELPIALLTTTKKAEELSAGFKEKTLALPEVSQVKVLFS